MKMLSMNLASKTVAAKGIGIAEFSEPACLTHSEAVLRLSKHKIEYLSDRILKMIQEHSQIHIISNTDLVTRAIDDAIFENLREEDEIDAEVETLVEQNSNEIRAMEMDIGALRNKIKREIARKRRFTL